MDFERIYGKFMELASIGQAEDGSVTRLLFSETYLEALEKTKAYMGEAGLTVWTDSCKNLHGEYRCGRPGAKTIYFGSHLDTVKEGGLYDGMLGIVAAVEAFRDFKEYLGENGECYVNFHLLGTNGEEGNDLGGTFGSRAMTGLLDPDAPGYMERAAAYGLSREDFETVKLPMDDALCYLELHIEQGNTLEKAGENIGIVTGIVGLERYEVTVTGESNHAGTTMMEYRKDALVGAARLIEGFDRIAREIGNQMVATVGTISVSPGAVAVIPGRADMVLEIRNLSAERMEAFMEKARALGASLPDVKAEFCQIVKKAPVRCDEGIMEKLETVCERHGYPCRRMSSGATHDGNAMAMKMPIAMIFVPSKDGISHSKKEFTAWDDAAKGMTVLAEVLRELNEENGRRFR